MDRRAFLKLGAGALIAAKAGSADVAFNSKAPQFSTANKRWQAAYDAALQVLAGNVQTLPLYPKPVLIEGSVYQGIWMECGPHEALTYRKFRPDVARNSHMAFFALQREDGQLPAMIRPSAAGFGQIQMVVPIAATAWELAQATGDDELLHTAYAACSRWDDWLVRYRNTRGTGLVEGFCTWDTGNDNSPRWAGMPDQCPGADARKCSSVLGLPRLCPDLSATEYGARTALAAMAKALGKKADADRWTESAETLRKLILSKLYAPEDAAFYDLDAQGHFVKIRSEILTRVCSEHVPDQALFDDLWTRQIHNPKAFWAAYPLPSIALDDPAFVRPIPRNSWGGAAQALIALRAGRWFDHYGRAAEHSEMMDRWCEAIQREASQHAPGFRQQIDPLDGSFTQEDAPKYSPSALVMIDYTWRLAGIHEEPGELHWNIRPGHPAAESAHFRLRTDEDREAKIHYNGQGAEFYLAGKPLGRVQSGAARLVTDKEGVAKAWIGISPEPQKVIFSLRDGKRQEVTLKPNQRAAIQHLQLGTSKTYNVFLFFDVVKDV
ncbi:MAG TPA: alpha-L-rhamnosidase [Acidobacteriaceae bacterium]|jgi:hypothetical protein|nr:alpha-L-rhamnosidase [Acidobacteriaceae bacterium]